jgi:hypothetical protein
MAYALHGAARPASPVCIHFNVAVHAIANRLYPCGFDVGPTGPQSLEELNALLDNGGRLMVWDGASETTMFDCRETNYAWRAWHDWCHYKLQAPFNMDGERLVVEMQKDHLRTVYGANHPLMAKWCAMVDADIIGILEYHERTGEYPEDQRAVVEQYLAEQVPDGRLAA